MPTATQVTASDTNEDARSTSSTLVNGDNSNRNETENGTTSNQIVAVATTSTDDRQQQQQQQQQPHTTIRHGFDQEVFEEDIIRFLYYSEKRHDTNAKPHLVVPNTLLDWRLRERIKTVSGLLVICLNIGTDPPDIVKTNPSAKLECWIDPFLLIPQKSLETIGKNLHTQYENINSRTRFKLSLDPSVEETKKLCCQTRRNAKEERILFHYNGHGVPKPTSSGEIWVFNRNYTQYIPVSLFDLQSWLGSPVIYVWDCSSAGNIVNAFNRFAEQRDNEALRMAQQHQGTATVSSWRECIQLAACGPTETLPMNPDLPADVFTSCLTTPIEMSLRWVIMRNPLLTSNITMDMVLRLPGCAKERRTPLGELNWIFTAVTDTIAWCVLQDQPELFKRLFRQDLMVASMFRNFLLAERIMRAYQCTPISTPKLPDTHDHPMWQAWDLAVDMCLFQLPALLAAENNGTPYQYQPSSFFAEQLTAFEVWLSEGAVNPKIPEQLPIVLQVLLSQVHRLRALILLSRFLDLGPWAVNAALSVGIFPYVLKLLQSPAAELKPVLVFIWARILAVDRSCQNDLLKDHGYAYFINILTPNNAMLSIPHVSEHRAMSAFILSVFCTNFKMGQQACLRGNVITACLAHVKDPDPLLRQWVCLCLAQVWMNNSEAKAAAIAENGHEKLCALLGDSVPEVRASVMYALGTFLGGDPNSKTEQIMNIEHNIAIAALAAMSDGSPVVRKEFVIALSHIVHQAGANKFLVVASQTIDEDQPHRSKSTIANGTNGKVRSKPNNNRSTSSVLAEWRASMTAHYGSTSYESVYAVIWKALLNLSVDPYADVAKSAAIIVDQINTMLLDIPTVGDYVASVVRNSLLNQSHTNPSSAASLDNNGQPSSFYMNEGPQSSASTSAAAAAARPAKLTRSVSFASTLRTIYNFGNASPSNPADQQHPPTAIPDRLTSQTNQSPHPRSTLAMTSSSPLNNSNNTEPLVPSNNTIDNVLPLSSEFYDWSCEYFTEPQMRAAESDEPGSVVYTQRKWRRSRNEKMLLESNSTKAMAGSSRWEDQIISVHNETEATHLLFHQYEPHLVASDAFNCLVVWDWKTGVPLSVIDNHNPSRSRITDMKFINEDDVALLLTGSDDGVVRLYKNYDASDQEDAILVSSWRALKDMEKSNSRQSGLVCEWHQGRGALFTGGDARAIKVWDAHQEMTVMDIATQSGGCVTSITSDQVSGNILVAGFGDGMIGVYDRRLRSSSAMVQRWDEHNAWVTKVHLQRDGNRELVSGGFAGDIKIWDIRESQSIRTIDAYTHADMTSLAVHDHHQVIASAGDDQVIKFWNMEGSRLSTIRPSTGFLSQKSSFTRALTFHPNLMVVAASSDDGYITLYGAQ
ncbi:raptor N-terminal caspase like domain-containing protein [Chlamydoabsidia padenii]|nr:raptor N-terminal caspase like domain-containing protein [Chlamydoabsidia padenii]